MAEKSDEEMAHAPPVVDEEKERKKALLVYKSNQHSASDDDEEEEEEEEGEDQDQDQDQEVRHEEERTRVEEQDDDDEEADARSVRSETGSVEEEEDEDEEEDLEEEEDHVRVEKDDDESVNAPSDDDLDSTATPRHDTEEEDDEEDDDVAELEEDTEDSATESKSSQPLVDQGGRVLAGGGAGNKLVASTGGAPSSSSSSSVATSGAKLNVEEIIAARRRTGARKECEVCHEARNGRRAMLCANCKTMYHSSCYRKKYSKLISAMGKQWFCPDCEPVKQAAEMAALEMSGGADTATPRSKKKGVSAALYAPYDDPRQPHGKQLSGKDAGKTSSSARGKSMVKNQRDGSAMGSAVAMSSSSSALAFMAASAGDNGNGGGLAGMANASLVDQELKRVTEIAMRSSRKVSALILERATEMLHVTQSMAGEIEDVLGLQLHQPANTNVALPSARSILHHDEASSGTGPLPPLSALAMISSSGMAGSGIGSGIGNSDGYATDTGLLRSLHDGLFSLKNMLEQLQVMGIQSEMDLVRDIKVPPVKDDAKTSGASGHGTSASTASGNAGSSSGHGTSTTRKNGSGAAAARTAAALSAAAKREAKPGASRLYSAEQIRKLEDWYQKSSRPESSEIQSMYRIINSPDYADKELQPDGISVKQIRIWFDNRRAKERLDYMRLKMKDISTADMDADDVKRMKAAYIDEAKEVLEARVSRLKENGKSVPLIDAADTLLLQSSERPLPLGKGSKASPASKMGSGGGGGAGGGSFASSSSSHQKKRIRIDYVASVRKAVKEARDAGKNEDEIRLVKVAAIERARERLHVPYKNARLGPTKPLGKEEVTHVKMSMLKLLEEDAPAEELTDIIELLLSVVIPRDTLVESQLHRQLNLVLKAHKDNKELVKQTNKLLDEFNTIIEKGDDDDAALYDDELLSLSGGGGSTAAGGAAGGGSSSSLGMGLLLGSDDYDKSGGLSKGKKKIKTKDATNLLLSVDSESLPGTPGASPDSPGASPDARKARVKFSRDQLMKLERHFHKEDTPSKKNLETLSKKLNEIAARDAACDGQDRIDYKQIRSWFYKRRSTNQPPQALSQADLKEIEASGPASSSSSASETESDSNDESTTTIAAAPRSSSSGKTSGKSNSKDKTAMAKTKRKASDDKPTASSSNKRQKKSSDATTTAAAAASEGKAPSRGSSKKDSAATSAATNAEPGGKQHYGRIFNVKQLATIIEAYEKNPRPSVERLEELQKILNQDDHADDHFVNPLGVTKRQIKTWFSNRRAKERLEVIRMKVQTPGESGKTKSSSSSAAKPHAESGSEEDLRDDDMDDEDTPIKMPAKSSKTATKTTTAAATPGSSAKKELFTQEGAAGAASSASRATSDDDAVSDEDLSDDDDVDMGSDDEEDDPATKDNDDLDATNAHGDSDDENDSSSSSSSDDDDDDDDDQDDDDGDGRED